MLKARIASTTLAISVISGPTTMAHTNSASDIFLVGSTPEGLDYQAQMPAITPLSAMFLDMAASAEAEKPIDRATNGFVAGERIVICTKFANVGRTNPGAVAGFLNLSSKLQVLNETCATIIEQDVPNQGPEGVLFPYEGAIPNAYFDSFKLTVRSTLELPAVD